MNARQLTDAQVAEALRAWVPDRAQPGLRDQVLAAADSTTQQRPLPSFLGLLSDADPVARRQGLLIAAALLLALALASAAAVGALRLFQGPAVPELSLERPDDVQAFVLSTRDRMPDLPPVAFTWLDDGGNKGRIYVDRSGAVRFEQFPSADATEPVTYRILKGHRLGQLMAFGSDAAWVEWDAIEDDPRRFLFNEVGSSAPYFGGPGSSASGFNAPGCDTTGDSSGAGNGTSAAGWTYVGVEVVAGRPAHQFACEGGAIWIDAETRLALRRREPVLDADHGPVSGAFRTIEITEIEFGEQPATLFELTPPRAVARLPEEEFDAYVCAHDPVCAAATPTPIPTPQPTSSPTAVGPDASGPAGPLTWSKSSLDEDWPAPVRAEPFGGAIVTQIHKREAVVPDPAGDVESDIPWVDIRELQVSGASGLSIELATNLPPVVDPSEQWIAYGVVVDDDRDGTPDRRFGIDNIPVTKPGLQQHRAWVTDLHTGRTVAAVDGSRRLDKTVFATYFPGERGGGALLRFLLDTTGGPEGDGLVSPFYAWASVIENGRVVATDHAPDVGWLEPKH